jgi:hypothetical protein
MVEVYAFTSAKKMASVLVKHVYTYALNALT